MKPEFNCSMHKNWSFILIFLMLGSVSFSQKIPADSVINQSQKTLAIDTNINYEELFRDFGAFMDSISAPHNYFMANISLGKGYYNFVGKINGVVQTSREITYSPSLAYFHKSGFGISVVGNIVNDQTRMNFYQLSVTPSYDYLENRDLATGISFTKYFTKDSLSFYTSPLQNELYTYFTYRKWWFRPTVSFSYGWGSRSSYDQRENLIQTLRLRLQGFTFINSNESVNDFSVTTSIRHDFYWLNVLANNDFIRFTPQLVLISGTEKFGFNQSSNTNTQTISESTNALFNTQNVYLYNKLNFQPLSLSLYFRGEYSVRKFFIQPQVGLDYYFPATSNNFSVLASVNAGFIF